MRQIPTALANHMASDATTLCYAWRVTRADGVVLGFTEHDRDLNFDGTLFVAASGFQASDAEAATGLSADNGEVAGAFSNAAITEADLVAGRYDGAKVETFVVNWADVSAYMRLRVQEIGEVSRTDSRFQAELRSRMSRLDRVQGRIFARKCDASLGDGRCKVALAGWSGSGTVVSSANTQQIVVSGLGGFADGFFSQGVLTFASGALDGVKADIDSHDKAGSTVTLTFWLPLTGVPAAGDAFSIVAGCDKRFETCRQRFGNGLNFQGFPHMPGPDFAYSTADGRTVHDGRKLFD